MIPHRITIYQRPRAGRAFVASHEAIGYKHTIIAKGGFDTASFGIRMNDSDAEMAFADYLGCVVKMTVDNPEEPSWEGYIDRITWNTGGVSVSRGFDNMMNRVNVNFFNADSAGATKTENTTHYDQPESQAIFGLKEGSIDAGVHFNNADKTHKVYLRNMLRNIYSWPQVSASPGDSSGDGVLQFECKGLQYYAWDWQNYKLPKGDPLIVTLDLVTAFLRVVGDSGYAGGILLPVNAPYIYEVGALVGGSDWLRYVKTGASPANISTASDGGQTYLQWIQGLVEAGDGTNRFVFGITTPDPLTNKRYAYYNYADTAIKYVVNARSKADQLEDVHGNVVSPWNVKPNAGIRINDLLPGWDGAGDDPRIGYIERIEYDAESVSVNWQTGDDITLEGAMQRRKRYRKFGANDPFAAPPRQSL